MALIQELSGNDRPGKEPSAGGMDEAGWLRIGFGQFIALFQRFMHSRWELLPADNNFASPTSFYTRMRIIVVSEERQLTQRLRQALKDQSKRTATVEFRQSGAFTLDSVINEYTPDLILVMPRGGYRQRFLVRQGQKLQSIPTEDIYYFYSEERFIFFRTRGNQKFLVDYRIEELEKMLDPLQFFRVNRSYLISIDAIDQVYPHYGNRLKLITVLSTPKEIIVSRDRVPDFRAWMGE